MAELESIERLAGAFDRAADQLRAAAVELREARSCPELQSVAIRRLVAWAKLPPVALNDYLLVRQGGIYVEALTRRELEVLDLLATGRSNREIASVLVVSRLTVRNHLRNIYGKLGVNSRTAATRLAIDAGLLGVMIERPVIRAGRNIRRAAYSSLSRPLDGSQAQPR